MRSYCLESVAKMGTIFRVLLLVLIPICVHSQETSITFTPSTIDFTPATITIGTRLTIRCDLLANNVKRLFLIQIKKKNAGSQDNNLIEASSGDTEATVVDTSLKNISTSLSQDGKSISLTLNQAGCNDVGKYECYANYQDTGNNVHTPAKEAELKLNVGLGQRYMTASPLPFGQDTWRVGNKLTMECKGAVGSVNITDARTQTSDPKINWIWEYKDPSASDDSNFLNNDWKTYVPQSVSEITTGNFINAAGGCYQNQTSTLVRNLTLGDSGRQYRCYAWRSGSSSQTSQFAAEHTVGKVTVDGNTDDGGDDEDEPAGASVGAYVGGVIGALLLIAVIIIIIYFLVIRPRRRKQAAEEGDYPDKGDNSEAVPPYTTEDPSVMYSQPTRRNKDKRWNGADRRGEGATASASEEEEREVTQGLHYAELDLTRQAPVPVPKERKNAPVPKQRSAGRVPPPAEKEKDPPTEYASIRLY